MAAAAAEGLDAGVGVGESEVKGKSHSAPEIRRHVHYDDAGADAMRMRVRTAMQPAVAANVRGTVETLSARASSGTGEYSGVSRMSRRGMMGRGEVR